MSKIAVYTTDPCGYCRQAKALLAKRGLDYEEINLAKDGAGRAELAARTGMMTFPQVIIAGQLLGGFSEVQAAAALVLDLAARYPQIPLVVTTVTPTGAGSAGVVVEL